MRKILHAVTLQPCPSESYDRCSKAADRFRTVLTDSEILFSSGLSFRYLPFSDIAHVFRRVIASHAVMGCCGGDLEEQKLVMITRNGAEIVVPFSSAASVETAMNDICRACPAIQRGMPAPERK